MKVTIAGDSAGEGLAKILTEYLKQTHRFEKVSRIEQSPDDFYANLSDKVACDILNGKYDRAILVCGTGLGVSIAANKVPGIRAALCHDTYSAERAALSNNAQIITMGARVIGPELAKSVADAFLSQTFDEKGRSAGNVSAINTVDNKYRAIANAAKN